MPAGFPVKADYVTGDVLSAANMNDLAGTLNYLDPTAKGDLFPASNGTTLTRLAVGANDTVLTADSSTATGLKWAAAAGGASGLTLVKTQTIGTAVSSVTVTAAFSSTYDNYLILISGGVGSTDINLSLQLGAITTGYYALGYFGNYTTTAITWSNRNNTSTFGDVGRASTNSINTNILLQGPNLPKRTHIFANHTSSNTGTNGTVAKIDGMENSDTQHTAFTLGLSSGTLTGGTIKVYGYAN